MENWPQKIVFLLTHLNYFWPFLDFSLFISSPFFPNFPENSRFPKSNYFLPCQQVGSGTCCNWGVRKKHFSKAAASDNQIFYLFLCVVETSENMFLFWCVWGQWLCDSRVSPAVCSLWQLCLKSASPGSSDSYWGLIFFCISHSETSLCTIVIFFFLLQDFTKNFPTSSIFYYDGQRVLPI